MVKLARIPSSEELAKAIILMRRVAEADQSFRTFKLNLDKHYTQGVRLKMLKVISNRRKAEWELRGLMKNWEVFSGS